MCNYEFRGSYNGLLNGLARYPIIFSHIGHIAMAAYAPDLHKGDLGHLEEVKNGLIGADTVGYTESTKNEILVSFALNVRRGSQHFLLQQTSLKTAF